MKKYKLKSLTEEQLHESPTVIRLLHVQFIDDKDFLQEVFNRYSIYFEEVVHRPGILFFRDQKVKYFRNEIIPSIIKFRRKQSISQKKLSRDLGFGDYSIMRYETGKNIPEWSRILKIADHIGIEV